MLSPAGFEVIAGYLKAQSGLVITPDKLYLLETRLGGILKEHKLADLQALSARLAGAGHDRVANDKIGREVVEAMTTNESFFFRDDKPFAHFRKAMLPALHAARPAGRPLRVWSAASSSGQEGYSLAMIVADSRPLLGDRKVELVGTDIAREQLARAREGLYSQFEVQRGLPVALLMKYFTKDGANWRVKDALRAMVEFREWNLLGDLRPLGQFDVIFCRNVLIYFDQPTKAKVLEAMSRMIAPDGCLYLGGAETVLGITESFAPLASERGVYVPAKAAAPRPVAAKVG